MMLSVPLIADDDVLTAAFRYAAAGWYCLPVRADAGKNPGSVVGKGWQHQSSRDPQQLAAWFAGTDYLLALHVGRSGAVVFDVDHPDELPDILAAHLFGRTAPPHQSSRPDQPGRGHYVFAQPPGRMIGNSTGGLGKGWGEVRGKNGVIIVAPSRHARDVDGARYEWLQTGEVPSLPDELAELLPDAGEVDRRRHRRGSPPVHRHPHRRPPPGQAAGAAEQVRRRPRRRWLPARVARPYRLLGDA